MIKKKIDNRNNVWVEYNQNYTKELNMKFCGYCRLLEVTYYTKNCQ